LGKKQLSQNNYNLAIEFANNSNLPYFKTFVQSEMKKWAESG